MATDRAIPIAQLLRAELGFPGIPVPIPLLLRVRWAHKSSAGQRYRIGLQFLP